MMYKDKVKLGLVDKESPEYKEYLRKAREGRALYKKRHPERVKAAAIAWRKKYKDRLRIYAKDVAVRDREKIRARSKRYFLINPRGRYIRHLRNCRVRGRTSEITFEQFKVLIGMNCTYCGKPGVVGDWNGMDRVDNKNAVYSVDTVVPCCKECNYAKRSMPYDAWMAWLDRITAFHLANHPNKDKEE